MIKTTLSISGMTCGMCEAHINDAIRTAFPVRKVKSSHASGETVILSDAPLNREKLRQVIEATGYIILSVRDEAVETQSLLKRLLKR